MFFFNQSKGVSFRIYVRENVVTLHQSGAHFKAQVYLSTRKKQGRSSMKSRHRRLGKENDLQNKGLARSTPGDAMLYRSSPFSMKHMKPFKPIPVAFL